MICLGCEEKMNDVACKACGFEFEVLPPFTFPSHVAQLTYTAKKTIEDSIPDDDQLKEQVFTFKYLLENFYSTWDLDKTKISQSISPDLEDKLKKPLESLEEELNKINNSLLLMEEYLQKKEKACLKSAVTNLEESFANISNVLSSLIKLEEELQFEVPFSGTLLNIKEGDGG